MKKYNAKDLISRYTQDKVGLEEKKILEDFFLHDLRSNTDVPDQQRIQQAHDRTFENLNKQFSLQHRKTRLTGLIPHFAIAASILLILAAGSYFLFKTRNLSGPAVVVSHDIAPGGAKAILTLANGSTIVLNDVADGKLAQQGNVMVNKNKSGVVTYNNPNTSANDQLVYNTLTTPKGGIYHLVLSDGTAVTLNSGSSITYPASFPGSDRIVSITGEVYFEVIHNSAKPFIVKARGQMVEDLGTHFNVNAYADEPVVKTTLLEGKIKVTLPDQQAVYLKPGQEAINDGQISVRDQQDKDEAIAWKDGYFHFNQADIPTVMRALARWYNVDLEYRGRTTARRFSGDIARNLKASQALEILSLLNIHFRIEAQKIIVLQ